MIKKLSAVLITVLLLAAALPVLFLYLTPMQDRTYNLSILGNEDGQPWQGDKGWTVYTDVRGQVSELTPTGAGGYTGLAHDGQTFYFSRPLREELDSPTLRIGVANRTISVFLDDVLLYTDCPELDNRIGWLALPMLEYDRAEPVVLSLPLDYLGKTLTIAQSSGAYADDAPGSAAQVFPCDVSLFCGYAYESTLIAQCAQYLIPAALLFAFGLVILTIFLWNTLSGRLDLSLLFFALFGFCLMGRCILSAPFFLQYFEAPPVDLSLACFYVSITLLLAFLSCHVQHFRPALLALALLHAAALTLDLWREYHGTAVPLFAARCSLLALLLSFALACLDGWRRAPFSRLFCLAALSFAGVQSLVLLLSHLLRLLPTDGAQVTALWVLLFLLPPYFVGLLCATSVQTVRGLIQARSETALLVTREQFARTSYDSLRIQTEQTLAMRHDMRNHLLILQTLLSQNESGRAQEYLGKLVTQTQEIRPMVYCGNPMLDILLNGKLNEAICQQVQVEITHAEAPEALPLSDPDLASLVMNVMDNAVQAALHTAGARRFIRLDLRIKGNFFLFTCENSVSEQPAPQQPSFAGGLPLHGYGIKIVDRVLARYGGVRRVRTEPGRFQIILALPLR